MWQITADQREQFLRLGASVIVGLVIGLDRHIRHKPAGVRTHGLVSLAAAVVTLGAANAFPQANVVQALQGVVSGVGFLGAGVILHAGKGDEDVHGLTTAASVWFVASVGATLGLGGWYISLVATLFGMFVLLCGGLIEDLFARELARNKTTQTKGDPTDDKD
jgi:putative Mg2+ transporter-C (MgtC) family protein